MGHLARMQTSPFYQPTKWSTASSAKQNKAYRPTAARYISMFAFGYYKYEDLSNKVGMPMAAHIKKTPPMCSFAQNLHQREPLFFCYLLACQNLAIYTS